jgi:hypothetical protein
MTTETTEESTEETSEEPASDEKLLSQEQKTELKQAIADAGDAGLGDDKIKELSDKFGVDFEELKAYIDIIDDEDKTEGSNENEVLESSVDDAVKAAIADCGKYGPSKNDINTIAAKYKVSADEIEKKIIQISSKVLTNESIVLGGEFGFGTVIAINENAFTVAYGNGKSETIMIKESDAATLQNTPGMGNVYLPGAGEIGSGDKFDEQIPMNAGLNQYTSRYATKRLYTLDDFIKNSLQEAAGSKFNGYGRRGSAIAPLGTVNLETGKCNYFNIYETWDGTVEVWENFSFGIGQSATYYLIFTSGDKPMAKIGDTNDFSSDQTMRPLFGGKPLKLVEFTRVADMKSLIPRYGKKLSGYTYK